MHFSLVLHALVVPILLLWTDSTAAHSVSPRPLKRVANPSTLALEILPRKQQRSASPSSPFTTKAPLLPRSTTLRFDDSFRLTIAAFDETFHLHLRPNDHLIHPAARISYYALGPDGSSYVTQTKPLLRESVKAYVGEVIHADHSETRMREDAAGVVPTPHPSELGWARIMVHHQGDIDSDVAPEFEGSFTVDGVVYHVATKDNYYRNKRPLDPDVQPIDIVDSELVIWRDSDIMTHEEERIAYAGLPIPVPETCGHDKLSYNTNPQENAILLKEQSTPWLDSTLNFFGNVSKRDDVVGTEMGTNFVNNIGQTIGCPNTQKVLYMGVAADCVYVQKYGSHANATKQILNNWNSASSLYKSTFNISLGIIELQIQSEVCPKPVNASMPWNVDCSTVPLNDRLSLFSQWRGAKGSDGVGLWHLMSGCPTGSEVGIAWLATLCQQSASGSAPSVVSGTAVSTAGLTEWQVIAHEIGHNFGAIVSVSVFGVVDRCADGCTSTSACCPLTPGSCNANARFIMSPVAQKGEKTFSPCSLGNICSLMTGVQRTNTTCLQDPSSRVDTISLQMCGNGIVEAGEQCDPGEGVDSPCCDSKTCKFKTGAVCDPDSSPCCTAQCRYAPTTQVCRPAVDSKCDVPETCTGVSSDCPPDITAPNGQSCGANDLACASGMCTSVGVQCQMLGGSMNLTRACPSTGSGTCQVSCQDPRRADQCIVLTALLVDGSPCGYGGICASGQCQSNGLFSTAKAWFTQNLQIAIPVSIVAGLFAILIIWALIRLQRYIGAAWADQRSTRHNPWRRWQEWVRGRGRRHTKDWEVLTSMVSSNSNSNSTINKGKPPPQETYWVDPRRGYNGGRRFPLTSGRTVTAATTNPYSPEAIQRWSASEASKTELIGVALPAMLALLPPILQDDRPVKLNDPLHQAAIDLLSMSLLHQVADARQTILYTGPVSQPATPLDVTRTTTENPDSNVFTAAARTTQDAHVALKWHNEDQERIAQLEAEAVHLPIPSAPLTLSWDPDAHLTFPPPDPKLGLEPSLSPSTSLTGTKRPRKFQRTAMAHSYVTQAQRKISPPPDAENWRNWFMLHQQEPFAAALRSKVNGRVQSHFTAQASRFPFDLTIQ
ncbi:Zinc metalloprotease [Mycena indigotica]|uniref:Disintegrin and metalloproteinase domain-containing protein B n=1 Tax=Mycena indigotica TaxID=2126181 RepID=A0A8H6SXD9_9AGAR|nr:Zinc metalloprotease [Mycena indigotica]KAF7306416.1 Zinc metalloprotease [Mycena indigotica]